MLDEGRIQFMQLSGGQAAWLIYMAGVATTMMFVWRTFIQAAVECESCEYHRNWHLFFAKVNEIAKYRLLPIAPLYTFVFLMMAVVWPWTLLSRAVYARRHRTLRSGCAA